MKNTRRLLLILTCIFMIALSCFLFSCNRNNNENPPPAHQHEYEVTIKKYPSAAEKGTKTYTCKCGHTYDEEIESLLVSLPDMSNLLSPLFAEGECSLKVENNSKVIYVRELDTYETEEKGLKTFVIVELADAMLKKENNVLSGHLKLAFHVAHAELDGSLAPENVLEPQKYDEFGALYLYVNGDDIAVELESLDEKGDKLKEKYNYDANELLCKAFASISGMDYEDVLGIANIGVELKNYLPLIEGALTTIGSAAMPDHLVENIKTFATLFGDALIGTETDANGNTVYYVDAEALSAFVTTYEDVTVASFIDAQYGAGTMNAITEFANGILDMKVKDVAEKAIAFSKAYGIEIDRVYGLVNYVIYLATGQNIDIELQILIRYENTLGDILCEAVGMTQAKDEYIASIKNNINAVLATISPMTIDQIYNMAAYGTPNYVPDGADEPFSILQQISGMAAFLEGVAEITVDAEGTVLDISINVAGNAIQYADNGDGTYAVSLLVRGVEMLSGTLSVTADGVVLSGTVNADGAYEIYAERSSTTVALKLSCDDKDLIVVEAALDEATGSLTSAGFKLYTLKDVYDDDTGEVIDVAHNLECEVIIEATEENKFQLVFMGGDTYAAADIEIVANKISANVTVMDIPTNEIMLVGGFLFETVLDADGLIESVTCEWIANVYMSETPDVIELSLTATATQIVASASYNNEDIYCFEAQLNEAGQLISLDVTLEAQVPYIQSALTVDLKYDKEQEKGTLKIEVPGVASVVADCTKQGLTLQVIDLEQNNVMLDLSIGLDEAGVITNAALKVNEYKRVYDMVTYESELILVNLIDATYTKTENGLTLSATNDEGIEFALALESLANGISVDVLAKDADFTYADGAVSITTSSTEKESAITLDICFDTLYLDSFVGNDSDDPTEINPNSWEYLVIDTAITLAVAAK